MRVLAVGLMLFANSVFALDNTDIGSYAIVHSDGHITDKVFRVLYSELKWKIEDQKPDGSWQDVTCGAECVLVESTPVDIEHFLIPKPPENITATCVHNKAFAFCRVSSLVNPSIREYAMIVLTEAQPILITLARVAK